VQGGATFHGRVSSLKLEVLLDSLAKLLISYTSRVEIYCAAHAILACTVFVDMAQHTRKSQLETLAKSSKQWLAPFYYQ